MAYGAEISRVNPTCILFLVDQSGSMADRFGNSESSSSKADQVATIINRFLQNLVVRCAKAEGIRDYFEVGVIGYGNTAGFALRGALDGVGIVPISRVAASPLRVEERTRKVDDGAGGLVDQPVKFPVWFDAIANGGTPMGQALGLAQQSLLDFVQRHPDCFPPIVVNITDGEATDGDPSNAAVALRQVATSDGNVLLFNVHCSSTKAQPIIFPADATILPDRFAQLLFSMSSELTESMRVSAQADGIAVADTSRGFVFNADPVALITLLDIGTRASNLR
jgi:hypothetical protein